MPIQFLYPTPAQMPQFQPQPSFADQLLRVSQLWQEAEKARMEREQQRQEIEAGRNAPKMLEAMLGVPTTPPIVAPVEAGAASRAALSAAGGAGGAMLSLGSVVGGGTRPLTEPTKPPATTVQSISPAAQQRIRAVAPFISALPVKQRAAAVTKLVMKAFEEDSPKKDFLASLAANRPELIEYMDDEALRRITSGLSPESAASLRTAIGTLRQNKRREALEKTSNLHLLRTRLRAAMATVGPEEAAALQSRIDDIDAELKSIEQEKIAVGAPSRELQDKWRGKTLDETIRYHNAQIENSRASRDATAAGKEAEETKKKNEARSKLDQNAARFAQTIEQSAKNEVVVKKIAADRAQLLQSQDMMRSVDETNRAGDSAAAFVQLQALFTFIRSLDNSVVKAGELDLFRRAGGLEAWFNKKLAELKSGRVMSDGDIRAIKMSLSNMVSRNKALGFMKVREISQDSAMKLQQFGVNDPQALAKLVHTTIPWTDLTGSYQELAPNVYEPAPVPPPVPGMEPRLPPYNLNAPDQMPASAPASAPMTPWPATGTTTLPLYGSGTAPLDPDAYKHLGLELK